MTPGAGLNALFDQYSDGYEDALNAGLSLSGETMTYFARQRLRWLNACLSSLKHVPRVIVDYGCGIGDSAGLMQQEFGSVQVIGLETAPAVLAHARRFHGGPGRSFHLVTEYAPSERADLAYCNGVFHHIPPDRRARVAGYVYRCLRPGGLFSFWDNNPWNPGARYVMRRIPFDRDAVMLSAREAGRLLQAAGFEILRSDHLFIFPRRLWWLRWLEPRWASLPLGAQFHVLARRPDGAHARVS